MDTLAFVASVLLTCSGRSRKAGAASRGLFTQPSVLFTSCLGYMAGAALCPSTSCWRSVLTLDYIHSWLLLVFSCFECGLQHCTCEQIMSSDKHVILL